MIEDLEKGDVAETAKMFFEQSSVCKPAKTSTLTLSEVNESLKQLVQILYEHPITYNFPIFMFST